MSHELRTPLNAIIGFSEILQAEMRDLPEHERWWEHAGIVRDSGQQLLVMVNELLDVSKIEAGHYRLDVQPIDVLEIARVCRAALQPVLSKKQVTLALQANDDLPDIEGDPRCVRQILLNLFGNAVKFSRQGGAIRLLTRSEGSHVVLQVIDEGIGIAPADLERVGQPFVQVASDFGRQYEGTGLGLSLVKGMVRLHNGTFSIESQPGYGTTVTLQLPIKQGAPALAAPVRVEAPARPVGQREARATSASVGRAVPSPVAPVAAAKAS